MEIIKIQMLGKDQVRKDELTALEDALKQFPEKPFPMNHPNSPAIGLSIAQTPTFVRDGLVRTNKFVEAKQGWRQGKYGLVHPSTRSEVLLKYDGDSDDIKAGYWRTPEPPQTTVDIVHFDCVRSIQGNAWFLPSEAHYLLDEQIRPITSAHLREALDDMLLFGDQTHTEVLAAFYVPEQENWTHVLYTPKAVKYQFERLEQ